MKKIKNIKGIVSVCIVGFEAHILIGSNQVITTSPVESFYIMNKRVHITTENSIYMVES